jgi:hypothetical protein
LENDGAERIDLERDSGTYQKEVRRETPKVIPQNEEHSIRRIMKVKSAAAGDMLDSRKAATIEKARVLANLAGFSVHRSWEFNFGKVFKVLWSEPLGDKGPEITVPTLVVRSGTDSHEVRRFVVVKSGERQATCL